MMLTTLVGRKRSTKEGQIEILFESKLSYLDLVQEVSEKVAQVAGFDEDSRYWITLSVCESVANAIQHGNKLDDTKTVSVRFEIRSDRVIIFVTDQGEGFEEGEVPDPRAPENLLKPSGRGIFYLRSFMDEVSFRKLAEGGLEVRMEKALTAKQGGST